MLNNKFEADILHKLLKSGCCADRIELRTSKGLKNRLQLYLLLDGKFYDNNLQR